jgi:Carboxypeptidase regulatory-like domain/TonB dependent receptor/TonB-dependent Receptor Plug Domain
MQRKRGELWFTFLLLFCLAAASALIALPASAQEVAGTITGTISDASGAAVAGATVTARDVERGTFWPTTTNEDGVYTLPHLPPGNYDMTVEAKGFDKAHREQFTLILNQVARVDIQLKIGQVSSTVEVSTAPPLLQTDATELGTLVNSSALLDLPLSTRDINQLTLLAPGVVSPNIFAFQSPQTTFGTGRPYVNGAREQDNNFQIDGMDANQPDNNEVGYVPSPDAVEEFNLIAGNAPADFGNYIGGVIVETIKSGTNQYHGELFEFLRNTDLDANSWQNKAIGFFNIQNGTGGALPRPPLHWNEFGATLGGPIFKNKLFFFSDFQGSRFDTPASPTAFAPIPAAFRTGDFSSLCTAGFTAGICNDPTEQLYDPASSATPAGRKAFQNNQVPIRSTVAQNILNSPLLPGPDQTSFLKGNVVNAYQGDLKIDWQPTEKDHVMGRYSQLHATNDTTNSIALLPSLSREYPLKNMVVNYSRAISPTLVNEARFGVQLFPANDQVFSNTTGQNLPQVFGIPGVQDTNLPLITLNGTGPNGGTFTSFGTQDLVEIFHDNTYEFEDNLTWTHGKHTVHFGFEAFHYIINDLYPGNQGLAGAFTFSGQFTGNTGSSGGNGVADFLLGLPSDVQEGTPSKLRLRNSLFGAFIQDNFRVRSDLTLTIGLRYEITTPRGDSNSVNNVNFNLFSGEPEIGANYRTYTGIDNFQPRLGLAWQPAWAHNTVFRAAYGVSTYQEGNGVNNLAVINPPNVIARDENNTGLNQPLTTLDEGYASFPAATCTAATLQAFSPNCLAAGVTVHATNPALRPAVDQQWNLTVQHQFGRSATLSVGYVGNKIDHESDIFLLNQAQIVGGILEPGPFAQPLVNTGASVRYNDSEAIQRFDALEISTVVRPYHGLQALVNYTWSKCLSNSLGYFGQFGDEEGIGTSQTNGGYFFFQNAYNQQADYGRCISDIAGLFNGYMIYELPIGKGKWIGGSAGTPLNLLIGGWAIASDVDIHSGFAINPAAPDQSGTGGGVGAAFRPNCVPGAFQYGNGALEDLGGNVGVQFLNPLAVTLPSNNALGGNMGTSGKIGTVAGTFGNCGVGAFRGPALTTADLNIIKRFRITERFNLEFMAQFLNVTNTPIFSAPAASCGPLCNGLINTNPKTGGSSGAGTFGLAQSPDPGREIQFGLKLHF